MYALLKNNIDINNIIYYYNIQYNFYKIYYDLKYIKLLGITLNIKIDYYNINNNLFYLYIKDKYSLNKLYDLEKYFKNKITNFYFIHENNKKENYIICKNNQNIINFTDINIIIKKIIYKYNLYVPIINII